MKRLVMILAILAIFQVDTQADLKSDILGLTGTRTKLVWKRYPWCKDDYTPDQSMRGKSEWTNTKLVVYDTDENAVRYLDTDVLNHQKPRITRSGEWVTWYNPTDKGAWIRDFAGKQPKRKLIDGTACKFAEILACWVDPATNTEYLIGKSSVVAADGLYKIPFSSATGQADITKAVAINFPKSNGAYQNIDPVLSMSQDGTKIGCAYPWPDTKIFDLSSTTLLARRQSGNFGCQASVAPDNSYRFYHCNDEHTGVHMWDKGLSSTNWQVDFHKGLPGLPAGTTTDFLEPRWSNHVQFFQNTYPMLLSYTDPPDDSGEEFKWGQSAAWVQNQAKRYWIPSFLIAKWSVDFKSVEKCVMVSSDPRYYENGGDMWLTNGVTAGVTDVSRAAVQQHRAADLLVTRHGSVVKAGASTNAQISVRVTDARGVLVQTCTGAGEVTVDFSRLAKGVYVVSAVNAQGCLSQRVSVTR